MRTYDYHGTEVSLEKGTYRNGTVALLLNETAENSMPLRR